MAQTLFLPIQQVFSDLGLVGAGFKLETFETGTTTPLATYSDVALTIPNPNPTIADSAGRFPQIFIDDARLYKAVLRDADNNTVWESDPVDPKVFSLDDFDPRPTSFWGFTDGTSSVYTLVADPIVSEYSDTQTFLLAFHIPCAAAPTLTYVDGGAALSLKKSDGAGGKVDLEADDVLTSTYIARNDGVDIIILNPEKPFLDARNMSAATETLPGVLAIATQQEVDDRIVDDKTVVPATLFNLVATAIQNTDGYIRIPTDVSGVLDEIIIQWGFEGSLGAFTFPITFPNAALSISVCRRSNDGQESLGVSALSASGATFDSVENLSGNYIVVGY